MQKMPSANLNVAKNLWSEVMSKIHSGLKEREFEVSSYAKDRYYCTETGLLATDKCPSKAVGWYKKAFLPETCTTHEGTVLGKPVYEKPEETTLENSSGTSSGTSSNTASNTSSATSSQAN